MYRHFFKRFIDMVLSFIAILLLIPLWVILSIAIYIDDPGPVFFTQRRLSIHKKEFKILKFRTMKVDTPHDMPTNMLKNPEQWITKVGGFLRKTSLDELPQIFNIFLGQMSIIGPRPALWNQFELIRLRDENGSNNVRPGLTGWAQINGRDEIEDDVKAALDGEYVQKLSFFFDCKCFLGTVSKVISRDGVLEGGVSSHNDEISEDNLSELAENEKEPIEK